MILQNRNIQKYDAMVYEGYYSIKRHLVDRFPQAITYVVPTTLKGIGKSYSVWNEILVPDYLKKGKLILYLRWTDSELEAAVDEFKKSKYFETKLNFNFEWTKMKKLHSIRNTDTNRAVAYFITPAHFKTIKGLASLEENEILSGGIYWDEFLIPDGFYRKPKNVIEGFVQCIGSLFRDKPFKIFMTANNTNPQNPFMDYMFTDIGWPERGETFVDYHSMTVIESPNYNEFLKRKQENSNFETFARLNPQMHQQLFGMGSLNQSIYDNQDLIIYRLDRDVNFKFKFQMGVLKLTVYTYQDENGEYLSYITDQNTPSPVMYSGNLETNLQTGIQLIPDDCVKSLKYYINNTKVRYKSVMVMNIVQDWVIKYRDMTKPIDWTKEKSR